MNSTNWGGKQKTNGLARCRGNFRYTAPEPALLQRHEGPAIPSADWETCPPESFLAGSVPNLQLDGPAANIHHLGAKLDTDGVVRLCFDCSPPQSGKGEKKEWSSWVNQSAQVMTNLSSALQACTILYNFIQKILSLWLDQFGSEIAFFSLHCSINTRHHCLPGTYGHLNVDRQLNQFV